MEARAKWRRFGMIVVVVILFIALYTDGTLHFSSSGAISTGLQTPSITPPPTITTTTTAAPETTTQRRPVPHWQPIDRAVIVYADVVDDAVRFLRELGGGAAAKYVLVFSDDRILSSALHRLSSDRIAATVVLVADCGERLTVQRVVDIVDNDWLPQEMPVSSCEKSPRHSVGVARWLSISSGSFLFDAVRVLLFFGFMQRSFLSENSIVAAVQASEVYLWALENESEDRFALSNFIEIFHAPSSHVVLTHITPALARRVSLSVDATEQHIARWRSRLNMQQQTSDNSPFSLFASSNHSTLVSPFLFGGGRSALMELVSAVDQFHAQHPTPPGIGMELVLGAALHHLTTKQHHHDDNHKSVVVKFQVQYINDSIVCMGTANKCRVIRQLHREHAGRRTIKLVGPRMLLNTRHCMWTAPMQHAPLRQPPTCHSKWFDDYYLLHQGKNDAKKIPSALVAPNSLGAAWTAMGARDGIKQQATAAPQPPSEEPHLRLCVGKGRSAVLGMCAGYTPQMVATFVNTFAKFHRRSCTQLYLFVDEGQRGAFNATYGGEPDVVIVGIDALRSTLKLQSCGVVQWRKELFYEWLLLKERSEEDANWLRYVMVVDTRDAHFQADPFEPLRAMVPEVQRRLERVQRSSTPAAGVLYLVPERFEPSTETFFDAATFVLRERISDSCGDAAYQRGLEQPLTPLLPAALQSSGEGYPLSSLPYLSSALYFGDYCAVKASLSLMVQSMSATATTTPCGTSNDQGMLHCLGMGGFDNVRFPHDVVMLNPDTHPYTHMFRFPSDIQFYEPGAPRGRQANAFAFPCARSQRSKIFGNLRVSLDDTDGDVAPYSVIHETEYAPDHHFYVTDVLSKL
ncbi:membrane-associated protein, putative [Bodo saltans]|uniref:Membrane-associated protein, putative n=1 Tax=Bodo saltans TaxID=75058 RepID=A0A0S4J0G0_BODSA|nr:membrane-associated protein, putative [Bodo saltans]|eukprot:CUG38882.1 membrane-associated protein, putative [Bodo saltans]